MTNTFNRNDGTFAQVAASDLSGNNVTSVGGLTGAVTIGAGLTTSGGTLNTTSAIGFYAHKNGTTQTGLTHNAYTKLTFTTERFDQGSYYDAPNSKWVPPAGLVQISGQVFLTAHVATANNTVLKLIKNGSTDIATGIILGSAISSAACNLSCVDQANGTDFYELFVFFFSDDAGNDGVADGNVFHVYFCGHWVGT
jgi:hypothetical protein